MKLKEILKDLDYQVLNGSIDIPINDLKYDSRKVTKNDLYIALVGFNNDGHDYIEDAIKNGAKVIVVSNGYKNNDITVIKVENTRVALAIMSKNFFHNPAPSLITIGVTGTSGKTTTTHMIREMLLNAGISCGLIGSIGIKYHDKIIHTNNTTPESYEIYKTFREMVDNNITHVVMEVSSQSYKLNRLEGITFDYGVLTNITSDHIGPGEHESHAEYVSCKNKLFLNSKNIIVNNDSLYLDEVLKNVKIKPLTYSINNPSDLQVTNINLINDDNFFGTEFTTTGLFEFTFRTIIPGDFNVYNALCALTVCSALKTEVAKISEALLKTSVRGRMETALVTKHFKVIIDYAHTEDGMKGLIKTLLRYKPKRLISVFGGGGNRPKERRYSLGKIIGGGSDFCIITMDNPRFEELSSINNDIKVGLNKVNAKYIEIDDRSEAIKYACDNALDGDLILLVGKGHEEYQDIKGEKVPFSEIEIINEIKKNLK